MSSARAPVSSRMLFAAAAIAGALLGGCAGEGLTPASLSAAGQGATLETAATAKAAVFDPFNKSTDAAVGRREVLQNPTVADVMQPGPLPEMSVGRAEAPVTIIKYMSLTCPYCRKFQLETYPQLKREYIDTGKVRLILREFPIGFQSGAATIALRCAKPDKYFILYEKFLSQQASWVSQEVRTDPIFRVASQVGMTRAEFDACRENRAMIEALNQVKERGRTLGVIGTPNFFINGRLVKSVLGMQELRGMIDPILAGKTPPATASVNQ